ncbi:SGNH/GDSL hydrolase family protein [Streptomyces sp. NPDC051362]|uniref:SGNH/GDSL hydrolase family protein n=1 Tax=Streptomyces sp. NPDC051362 TaxID=3365651 RepID=UPI0037976BF8
MKGHTLRNPLSLAGTTRAMTLGAALLSTGAAIAMTGASAANATDGRHSRDYVALGDSYASAPLVPTQVDPTCLRSDNNYPSLVARSRAAQLTDVSCAGATTANMTSTQGNVPPQFDALRQSTDLVTITIGGNDIGFSTILGTCAHVSSTDPAGAPCQTYFSTTGADAVTEAIKQTAPKVSQVLRGIHHRAPHARVVVVGYPDLFPEDGVGCTSATVPLAAGDFSYLRDKEKELNTMLARQARKSGAEYVNTYTSTVGHDLCQPVANRWIETFAPDSPAAPVHPNAAGEAAMAGAVKRKLSHLGH